ncbi:MAG: hypothetical protein K5765_06790 [Clostridia bacterium]|nr:hypothetical protein [Clostridia bacterium]
MWLYFNEQGQLLKKLEHGEHARVGTTQFSIFAVFENITVDNIGNTIATIKLKKPDLTGSEYPLLLMESVSQEFELIGSENANNVLPFKTSDSPYVGFKFDFASFLENQDLQVLLDTPGLWEATITLVSSNNLLNVQGVATFEVQGQAQSQDETLLSYDLAMQQILTQLVNKIDKIDGIVAIESQGSSISSYEDGQIFFVKEEKILYIKEDDALVPYVEALLFKTADDETTVRDIGIGVHIVRYSGNNYLTTFRAVGTSTRFEIMTLGNFNHRWTGTTLRTTNFADLLSDEYSDDFLTYLDSDLSNYYTKSEIDSGYVSLNNDQTIYGNKTFGGSATFPNATYIGNGLYPVGSVAYLGSTGHRFQAYIDGLNVNNWAYFTCSIQVANASIWATGNNCTISGFSITTPNISLNNYGYIGVDEWNNPYINLYGHGYVEGIDSFDTNKLSVHNSYIWTGYDEYDEGTETWVHEASVYYFPDFEYDAQTSPYATIHHGELVVPKTDSNTLATMADVNAKQNALTFDSTPTENSTNPVTSGGIYNAIQTAVSGAFEYKGTASVADINALGTSATNGSIYQLTNSGTITLGSLAVSAGDSVIWNGTSWDKLIAAVDLTGYVTTSDLATALSSYVTSSSLASTLNSYVTTSDLSTELGSYATTSALNSAVSGLQAKLNYVGITATSISQGGLTPTTIVIGGVDHTVVDGDVAKYDNTYFVFNGSSWQTLATDTNTDTNYYYSDGGWSGLTYTLTGNGGASDISITIPSSGSITSGNDGLVTGGTVYTALQDYATEQYVDTHITAAITGIYKLNGSATVSALNNLIIPDATMNGNVYNMTDSGDLNNSSGYGGVTSVLTGDNVVFVWNNGSWYWDKLAATIDTSSFVTNSTVASSSTLGLIKIGYVESGKNYAVQLDANNQAFVNVPWTDTNTHINLLWLGETSTTISNGDQTTSITINNLPVLVSEGNIVKSGNSFFVFNGSTWQTLAVDTNTTYSSLNAVNGGTQVSLVTTGEKYTWNNKGTVSSVTINVGTGLAINSSAAITSDGTRTISIASGYKLPTTAEWNDKQDLLTAGTNINISSDGTISTTNQGDTFKIATNVSSYSLAHGVSYMIRIRGNGYVTINGNNYYGTFFLTHYSTQTTDTGTGFAGQYGDSYVVDIAGQRVTWDNLTLGTGSPSSPSNRSLTISCTGATMDIYEIQ